MIRLLWTIVKKIIYIALVLILAAAVLYFVAGEIVGFVLEPKLEKELTTLFGVPVKIERLYAHPLKGTAEAKRITFENLPEFDNRPHLDANGIEFDIDFMALRDKKVIIKHVILKNAFYLLSRYQSEDRVRNNIKTWHQHMKRVLKKRKKKGRVPQNGLWTSVE